jgi:hypothetical protein
MDFSHAGYKGGGVALPSARAARTLRPVAGDSTAQIQAAIDEVSRLERGADGCAVPCCCRPVLTKSPVH